MGLSLKGTESAGGVGRIPTQTSNISVDYRCSHCPRHPPSGPATKAQCGSLRAGWGRPALSRHGRTGAQGPPIPVPAVITGKGWGCIWGFPAASVPPLRRSLGLSISFKRKTKNIKAALFFKHYDAFLTLQVTVNRDRSKWEARDSAITGILLGDS